ncbi:fimbrial protein [Serratia quinivorans]|uniref:fimbrial protein n=1 Tax=Serratia quinivorans TaxID=137545 RepID=UPI003F9D047B
MKLTPYLWAGSAFLTISVLSVPAQAQCTRVAPGIDSGCDACGVGTALGRVNLTSTYLQPVGTPLGNSVFNLTSGTRYPDPNKVLYECDISDIGQIYEVFATNGDDRVSGYFDLGAQDGNPNYYATYFPYVGIRLTHLDSGKAFTRYWQSSPITRYATTGSKIQIRVKDFSAVRADLIRISSLPGMGASNYCGYNAANLLAGMASTTGNSNYICTQPNGYVTFQGPGIPSDPIGSDSATNFATWGTGRWNAMGMGTTPISSLSYTATCVARNVTPLVILPTISVSELTAGQTSQAQFTINIECDNAAVSGINTNNTALGLQVPYDSYALAQQLGLVNANGGVSHLLSSGYGSDTSVATGVGIALSNANNGTPMNFVGWARCSSGKCSQGNAAGWYPVLDGTSGGGSTTAGFTHYTTQLSATLERLPGQTVTAGKVDAKAYVWVKVQ